MIPTTPAQLLIVLLFVVPGFVFQGVRIAHRGRHASDVDLSKRILNAIATSAIFALVYLALFGQLIIDPILGTGWLVEHPRVGAAAGGLGAFLVPAVVALIPAVIPAWVGPKVLALAPVRLWIWLRARVQEHLRYDPTPSAWDFHFRRGWRSFVRIKLRGSEGWVAGYYGDSSYASSFPEEPQLFLEAQYNVDKAGVISDPTLGTLGVLIRLADVERLEFIALSDAGDADATRELEEGNDDRDAEEEAHAGAEGEEERIDDR